MIQRKKPLAIEETTNINAMKFSKKRTPQVRSRRGSVLMVAAMLLLNTLSAFAQAGGGFNSTDLKTGISNSLAVIMMFGFVLGHRGRVPGYGSRGDQAAERSPAAISSPAAKARKP